MGRKSVKENKSIYQLLREEQNWSREEAAARLEFISADRIAKIEGGRAQALPGEVIRMSQVYGQPSLCNHFCTKECEIGARYVPGIKSDTALSQIVLELLNSLNSLQQGRDRLIEISVDGTIEYSEIPDFIMIQNELKNISVTVQSLQFWVEKKLTDGKINRSLYQQMKNQ